MAKQANNSLKVAILIFIVGSIIPFSVGYFTNRISNSYQHNLPYISLGDNIKNKTTKGHLWFEEFMAGDSSINFKKDVIALFEDSKTILLTAQKSGDTELGHFNKTEDEELLKSLDKATKHLTELIDFTHLRYQNKIKKDEEERKLAKVKQMAMSNDSVQKALAESLLENSTSGEEAGGKLDQAFDEAYERVQVDMGDIITHVNEVVGSENVSIRNSSYVLIFCILILTFCLCYFLYRSQNKTQKLVIENEEKFKSEVERLEKINGFVLDITNGNFSAQLDANSKDDSLVENLNHMKERLKINTEDEQKRSWVNVGLAKIGEILRSSSLNDEKAFYNNIISFTSKYINANQGSLFVLNDDDEQHKFLELKSCYAYDKKRFVEKTIEIGEGLLGQCYVEKEYIFLTEVPDKYTNITSGLGEATPNCLILVPLKINEEVNGIMEIASFKIYEQFEIDFILKLAENIAASISSYRVNVKTASLLEQTQQQAEEMMAQEEEMRQNMEELKATQEEMHRVNHDKTMEIERLRNELSAK